MSYVLYIMVDNASYSQQLFVSTCVGLLSMHVRTSMHIESLQTLKRQSIYISSQLYSGGAGE